jgi:hypothetical protein
VRWERYLRLDRVGDGGRSRRRVIRATRSDGSSFLNLVGLVDDLVDSLLDLETVFGRVLAAELVTANEVMRWTLLLDLDAVPFLLLTASPLEANWVFFDDVKEWDDLLRVRLVGAVVLDLDEVLVVAVVALELSELECVIVLGEVLERTPLAVLDFVHAVVDEVVRRCGRKESQSRRSRGREERQSTHS